MQSVTYTRMVYKPYRYYFEKVPYYESVYVAEHTDSSDKPLRQFMIKENFVGNFNYSNKYIILILFIIFLIFCCKKIL